MTSLLRFNTVVAKKIIMAITGLAMCAFLVGHLAGNLQLLWSTNQFNGYSHFLTAQPVIILIELGLLAILIIHVLDALVLLKGNQEARPEGYYMKVGAKAKSDKTHKSTSSTFMMWSGTAILMFIVFHIWHFKYKHGLTADGQAVPKDAGPYDLARLVTSEFHSPLIAGIYVSAMVLLWLHLNHAVSSAITTLGANVPRYTWGIIWFGRIFAFVICLGFAILPCVTYLGLFGLGK